MKIRMEAYEEIKTKVAGVTHEDPVSGKNRQELIRRYVRPGTRLIPVREPKNPYGEGHAVRLLLKQKRRLRRDKRYHLGYVPKNRSKAVDTWLKKKKRVEVIVMEVTGGTKKKRNRGVNTVMRCAL